jgi:hypothetical protein
MSFRKMRLVLFRTDELFAVILLRVIKPTLLKKQLELDEMVQIKQGLARMLKGGVIMDVVNAEQAKIAEAAGVLIQCSSIIANLSTDI